MKYYIYGHIDKLGQKPYKIRKNLISKLNELFLEYEIDTVIYEKNQLFIDQMTKYPDPLVYENILLGYGIEISLEDNLYEKINYLLSFPIQEWRLEILNKFVKYAIDLYKDHILLRGEFTEEEFNTIEKYNYYKVLCLSECIFSDKLMNKKYQINK